jgi:hypothetical protein
VIRSANEINRQRKALSREKIKRSQADAVALLFFPYTVGKNVVFLTA